LILTGKWSTTSTKPVCSIGHVDIPVENIISITGIVNNDGAFLYAYSSNGGIDLGIHSVSSGAITNRNYTVIISHK